MRYFYFYLTADLRTNIAYAEVIGRTFKKVHIDQVIFRKISLYCPNSNQRVVQKVKMKVKEIEKNEIKVEVVK